MVLTGQCKKDFEKWAVETQDEISIEDRIHLKVSTGYGSISFYYSTPFSMQYGLYVDFFDSAGIIIDVAPNSYEKTRIGDGFEWWISKESGSVNDFTPKTREEARIDVIKQANKIYNEQ